MSAANQPLSSAADAGQSSSIPSASIPVVDLSLAEPNVSVSADSFSDPPEQHSPANIMNALYNDCLMELFDRVDTLDLYVLAYVCKRFREIAVKILKVRLKDTSFRRVDLIIYRRSVPKALRADCIRVFGPTGAFIFAGLDDNVVLRTIARHCTDFGKLDLMFLGIDAQTVTSLRPCFPELRKLTIPATNILDGCATDVDWQLEKLSMHVVNENPIMPSIKTPRLKKFNFFGRKFNVSLSGARIFEYLASNDVSTVCFDFCNFNWAQWCRLPECAPNLQKLRLFDNSFAEDTDTDGATNNQMPDRFRFLSVCLLHRCSNTERFMELLRGAPLQRLKIYGYKESSLIASICKLNTISILAIRGLARSIKLLDEDLERLERSLPNLREIAVKGYFSFKCIERILGRAANIKKFDIGLRFIGTSYRLELDAMNSISSIVAGRPDLALKIRIRRRYLRVPNRVLRPYAHWLVAYLANERYALSINDELDNSTDENSYSDDLSGELMDDFLGEFIIETSEAPSDEPCDEPSVEPSDESSDE